MMKLEVVEGRSRGRRFELREEVSIIGRLPGSEVCLEDSHVSARHARIVQGLQDATIADLGSTNGTAVLRAGQRIALDDVDDSMVLRDDDLIELGSRDELCRLRVTLAEDDESAQLVSVRPVAEIGPAASVLRQDPVTLRALYDVQSKIGRSSGLEAVLAAVAEGVFDLLPQATHVTVVLQASDDAAAAHGGRPADTRARPYLPVLTRARPRPSDAGGEARHQFVPITRSVYRKVLAERAAVLAADAPKQIGQSASLMGASVRSCIALPLWLGDEILGVLQVDNRDAPGMLRKRDLDVLLVIAEQASLAVANGRLIKRLQIVEERLRQENVFLKDREQRRRGGGQEVAIIGDSEAMRALLRQLDKVVDTNVTVLIEGDTGTGKELIASALHYRSRRRDKLFVAQNCAALAETLLESELFGHKRGAFTGATEDKKGLFEIAHGSTLFLDEITEAPMAIQSKLLRALQEGEIRPVGSTEPKTVNVRVVAATNRDLEAEVRAGRFREDLYYRLKVFPLRVPPLRERRGDIPLLIEHFLARYATEIGKPVAGITPETVNLLVGHDWPGNVRELQNEVQRMVIQADPGAFISPALLSPRLRRGEQQLERAGGLRGSLRETMNAVEKLVLLEALRAHDGNKTNTARALGITREGLHKKLRQHDL
jgi:Nif-specific regulatory protein